MMVCPCCPLCATACHVVNPKLQSCTTVDHSSERPVRGSEMLRCTIKNTENECTTLHNQYTTIT